MLDISRCLANKIFKYDSNNGLLIWRPREKSFFKSDRHWKAWNSRHAWEVAGCTHTERCGIDYVVINFMGRLYRSHRIILVMHGFDLNGKQVDHIDGNGTNNRLCNLRVVDGIGNGRNQRIRSTNKSGITGVTKIKKTGKWRAYITDNGQNLRLIDTYDFFEAACVRRSAELRLKYHKNHGRRTIEDVHAMRLQ